MWFRICVQYPKYWLEEAVFANLGRRFVSVADVQYNDA